MIWLLIKNNLVIKCDEPIVYLKWNYDTTINAEYLRKVALNFVVNSAFLEASNSVSGYTLLSDTSMFGRNLNLKQ